MADVIETQLVVLGAGPGGYAAAFLAADRGIQTTLVDPRERPGGTCLHVGCIPSKALLHAAKTITDAREATSFGVKFGTPEIDINGVRGHAQKVVEAFTRNLSSMSKARKVPYVQGKGRFLDGRTVETDQGQQIRFQNCIIATGSNPTRIPSLNIGSPRVWDSTTALELQEVPGRLLVVGGGYIGLELGYVYAALGSQVTVVELTNGLLPGVDRDLAKPLHSRLEKLFEQILLKTKVAHLEETQEGIQATLEDEAGQKKQVTFDRVLVAVGRKPNTEDLGLEKAKVEVNERGFIQVDERRRTSASHIFAIGDAAGDPMLAHKATHEAQLVAEVLAGEPAVYDVRAIPAVVFTDPEVAWCGLTESEARNQDREIKVLKFPWMGSGRAMTLGRTEGLTKMILDPATERILGVGIVGVDAGEMIAEATLAIEMSATARDLALTIHAHPTLTETVGESAESLYGLSPHHRPK